MLKFEKKIRRQKDEVLVLSFKEAGKIQRHIFSPFLLYISDLIGASPQHILKNFPHRIKM